MKTSNKIIIGILLVCFGVMAAAQLSLHKKYVDNDYITQAAYEEMFYSQFKPQGIKHVSIQNIAACQILPADSIKLAFENGIVQYANYSVGGDTLHITGVYNMASRGNPRLYRSSGCTAVLTRRRTGASYQLKPKHAGHYKAVYCA